MDQFGDIYSQYYDLLYSDKDYDAEVDYIDTLIRKNINEAKTILDMGCGTGIHADLLSRKGYSVHGIDLSKEMLNVANQKVKGREERLKFSHSNIQDLNLNTKFDIVVSLFHVMSYQNSNKDLINAFQVVKNHLNDGGLFIFDFWYGPAVLTDLPVTRVKRLENDDIKVTRVAEPKLNSQTNITEVNFDVFIEDKNKKVLIEKKETHNMRYFFDKELEHICKEIGFEINKKYKWMTSKSPDFKSWNVVWIAKSSM